MITLITKILAVIAVVIGFRISAKHWDGQQLITLIANSGIYEYDSKAYERRYVKV